MSLILKHSTHKLELQPTYDAFLEHMKKVYKQPEETRYIYSDNNGQNFIVQSKEQYDLMLKCQKDKPTHKELRQVDIKRKNKNENEEEEKSLVFINLNGEQEIIDLPSNFEDFSRKMQNSFDQKKDARYSYQDNNNQSITVETSSQYDEMMGFFKQRASQRILKVKDAEEDLDNEMQIMNDTIYPELFFGEKKYIDCVCKKLGKSSIDCKYCNGKAQIDYKQQGWYRELNQEFRLIIIKNYPKIKEYIKNNHKVDIRNFAQWLEFHSKLLNQQQDFILQHYPNLSAQSSSNQKL